MAIRVKLRIKAKNGKEVFSPALVNSGFETEKPQLLIPIQLAKLLDIWPPPPSAILTELGTAGGPVRNYLIPDELEVSVITNDREVGPVTCDAIISHIEEEVLINDKLGDEFNIIILRLGAGLWKFADDPLEIKRESEKPKYWI
jgi:hypothetical protein